MDFKCVLLFVLFCLRICRFISRFCFKYRWPCKDIGPHHGLGTWVLDGFGSSWAQDCEESVVYKLGWHGKG